MLCSVLNGRLFPLNCSCDITSAQYMELLEGGEKINIGCRWRQYPEAGNITNELVGKDLLC